MHPHYDDLDVPTCSIARWKTSEGSTATMPAGAVATGQSRRPSLFGVSWRVWVAGEGGDSGGRSKTSPGALTAPFPEQGLDLRQRSCCLPRRLGADVGIERAHLLGIMADLSLDDKFWGIGGGLAAVERRYLSGFENVLSTCLLIPLRPCLTGPLQPDGPNRFENTRGLP
jgi:hypothetical protein